MMASYEFRYGWFRPLLTVLGLGPRRSGIVIDGDVLRVKMGWAFRTRVPLAAVRSVARSRNRWSGVGVHGWAGRWLVNGSVAGIVTIEIDPSTRAWAVLFPVRLRTLHVSLVAPEDFLSLTTTPDHPVVPPG